MSEKHPIIAVTGSSGAGTSTVKNAFEHIFRREQVNPVIIEGDAFHRYNRQEMRDQLARAAEEGRNMSHFGPEANLFGELEDSFRRYGQEGICRRRRYLHSEEEAEPYGLRPGEFTEWEETGQDSDLLFYEGLHGGVVTEEHNVAQHVDLLVGVTPIVNLEWIQKIHRDGAERGYTAEKIVDTILRRMPDYVNYLTPQFSRTDINFQRVPTVDTSNPFIARDVPSPDESFTVIRFRKPERFGIDFPYLLNMIPNSFMSRRNTIVVPGGKTGFAMELILTPLIHDFVERTRKLKGVD